MSIRALQVIEPTLLSQAGHCAALIQSLRLAAPELALQVWVDRQAQLGEFAPEVRWQAYFHRRWRKLQALLLYRRLLRSDSPLLIPTASYFDLRALDAVAGGAISAGRVFLYFHKLRLSARRSRSLRALARRQGALELFGTSDEIVQRLQEAGYTQVRRLLPVLGVSCAADRVAGAAVPFTTLLYAGAARADKGFSAIVDLVEHLHTTGSTLPITVQISGDHYGRHDTQTAADIGRLRASHYPPLRLLEDTLAADHYARLFPGSICLQPYARSEYADKMSAVSFDALRAGAPIVTVAGTTMAALVEQTGAGQVLGQASPAALLNAIQDLLRDYGRFQERARAAGRHYAAASSWAPLMERLRLAGCAPAQGQSKC